MQKTNREKNQAHDQRAQERVRPKPQDLEFAELESVINSWIKESRQNGQA